MDVIAITIRELTETITKATEYQSRDVRRPQFLRMYNKDLQEDTTLLFRYLSDATNEQKLQVNELCTTARQLRRALETEAINLEIAAAEKPIPIKLPRLTLPVFDGNRSEFTFWYDFLTENVLSLNFNATAKWLYLRDCLKGRPAEMIAGYPLTAETLESALKLLKDVYGNPTALRNDLFQKLEDMPQSADNSKDLRMTYCKLEGILLSLERLGFYMDDEPYLRTLVIRKYPLRVMKELFAVGNSLNKVRQTAKQWVEIEEHISDIRGEDPTALTSSPPVTDSPPPKRKCGAQRNNGRRQYCPFCNESHWPDECQTFTTSSARAGEANVLDLCTKCLKDHVGVCDRARRCRYCRSLAHNRALCPIKFPDA